MIVLEKVQAPGKGVNAARSNAPKQMRGNVNKFSLERGYLETFMISSTEVHSPKKGVSDAGPKALAVLQAPGKGSQEEILEASRMMLMDIDGSEVAKAHIYGFSTHSVRLSYPFNDRLLGEKVERV